MVQWQAAQRERDVAERRMETLQKEWDVAITKAVAAEEMRDQIQVEMA